MAMARQGSVAKVICFTCRESSCGCVAAINTGLKAKLKAAQVRSGRSQVTRAVAWLGGACVAGTALGAAVALLLGG
jgi:hypothetical protein